ncbi:MAG TPA: YafY family transcriptional regulator [Vagococcus sp.]|uniref:Transcriptional regulator, DeoR family n=2 Tax=Enterococcaceae TaxID=81852 RepID=A0A1X6WQG7_9ENTE|nr:Transcriptional regulator, DeoR family [Vagococcus fluvialis bH819]HCM90799.1 YafY family transcriptional regulator [Vagococcus sp.]
MKIERLMSILVTLLSKRYLKAKEIADLYHVSVRTIYRDIDTLSLAGIPIYSKKGTQGGFYIAEEYQLNSLLFSDMEKKIIYDLSKSLASSYQHPKIEELSQKMAYLVQKNPSSSPYFFDLSLWKSNQLVLTDIEKAIENKCVISFNYTSYSGETTFRKVEPINLICKSHVWYLFGFCQLRQEERLFRISRIRNTQMLTEIFKEERRRMIEKSDLETFYTSLSQTVIMEEVSLSFNYSVKAKVYDTFLEEDIEELEDCMMVIKKMPKEKWLVEMLLSFGGEVKILSPDSLKLEIIKGAQNILSQYDIM